jgi:hypothetical protein
MRVDLKAPIIPDDGLAGLRLRSRIADLQELVDHSNAESFRLASPFEARYLLAGGRVGVGVDVRNGKVAKLIAHSGYEGALFGSIVVGMPVREALRLDSRLWYSETEEVLLCRGVPGVALDVPAGDFSPDQVLEMSIEAISVYAHEIETASGQAGEWHR